MAPSVRGGPACGAVPPAVGRARAHDVAPDLPDLAARSCSTAAAAIGGQDRLNPMVTIPSELAGWWRIVETSRWTGVNLDILGTALISLTGDGDRLRMFVLLAHVNVKPTKAGVSFTWEGAWEYDPVSGSGAARLGRDGRIRGTFKIKNGETSTFVAEKAEAPDHPIQHPPSYRDKWGR